MGSASFFLSIRSMARVSTALGHLSLITGSKCSKDFLPLNCNIRFLSCFSAVLRSLASMRSLFTSSSRCFAAVWPPKQRFAGFLCAWFITFLLSKGSYGFAFYLLSSKTRVIKELTPYLFLCPRQDSNPYYNLRKVVSYPLNDEGASLLQ